MIPRAFDGLKKRLTGAQVLTAGPNGLPVTGGQAEALAFFDALDELLAAVPGINGSNGAIYANANILPKVRSAMRHAGGVETVPGGRHREGVPAWQGVPILDPGDDLAGAKVLPQTETQGSSNVHVVDLCRQVRPERVRAVRHRVDERRGDGRRPGPLESKPAYRTRIEFYCGVAVFGGKAAARLKGLLPV